MRASRFTMRIEKRAMVQAEMKAAPKYPMSRPTRVDWLGWHLSTLRIEHLRAVHPSERHAAFERWPRRHPDATGVAEVLEQLTQTPRSIGVAL